MTHTTPTTLSTLREVPEIPRHWLDLIRRAVFVRGINPSPLAERVHISMDRMSALLRGQRLLDLDSLHTLLTELEVKTLPLDVPFRAHGRAEAMIGYIQAGPYSRNEAQIVLADTLPPGQDAEPSSLVPPERTGQRPSRAKAPKTNGTTPTSRSEEFLAKLKRVTDMFTNPLVPEADAAEVLQGTALALEDKAKAFVANSFKFH